MKLNDRYQIGIDAKCLYVLARSGPSAEFAINVRAQASFGNIASYFSDLSHCYKQPEEVTYQFQ